MKTAAFLRLVADAIDAGLPEPLGVALPMPGTGEAYVQVRAEHSAAWTRHLGITPGAWVHRRDTDREHQHSGPAPGTRVFVSAVRSSRLPVIA